MEWKPFPFDYKPRLQQGLVQITPDGNMYAIGLFEYLDKDDNMVRWTVHDVTPNAPQWVKDKAIEMWSKDHLIVKGVKEFTVTRDGMYVCTGLF